MARNLPTSTAKRPAGKKGIKTTPKRPKRPVAPRYIEVRIRVSTEDYKRGFPYFETRENLNKFALDALREKINRAEANDKAGRLKRLITDEKTLLTVIKHMKETGKLNFLIYPKEG